MMPKEACDGLGNDMMKLSQKLLELGFFSALGTTERCHKISDDVNERCVTRKVPNTWDYNNGIMFVYDEVGRPWILEHSQGTDAAREKLGCYYLTRGAYVPHSNDAGNFLRNVVQKL